MSRWLKQLFCSHSSRAWTTVQITETLSRTTGGCTRCGKPLAPGCERCGR